MALFSMVFAESAAGECYLLSKVPYPETPGSIWDESEYPALNANPNVTRVICVDARDNRRTQIIFENPSSANGA